MATLPASVAPEHRRAAPPPPERVKIDLRRGERAEIDPAFYRRIAHEVRELGVGRLGLCCAGETFACRWLPEAVRFAKQECGYPHVALCTDGRVGVAARVRECMETGLDELEFDLGTPAACELGEVTGARASDFKQVLENLKGARRVRDEVAAATGHRCGLLARIDSRGAQEVRPLVDACERGDGLGSVPCRKLFEEGHVTHDGRLCACCSVADAAFDMGDLVHHGFMRVWHGQAFQRLRRVHLAGDVSGTPCERCAG